jgi:hypothetical protein
MDVHLLAGDGQVGAGRLVAEGLGLGALAKDSTTGAWATSRASVPSAAGTFCSASK